MEKHLFLLFVVVEASEKEINLDSNPIQVVRMQEENIRGANKKRDYSNIVQLLESLEKDPNETRSKLRIELGFAGKFIIFFFFLFSFKILKSFITKFQGVAAASIYSLVVLFSDDYLRLKNT